MLSPRVVHGDDETVGNGKGVVQGVGQMRRECCDAALAGQVIAEYGESAQGR
jgi:hypothetical protein